MGLDDNALLLSLAIGCVGMGLFMYGRKQSRFPQMLAGVILMVYPYFVPGLLWMAVVGVAILAGTWVAVRLGL